MSGYREAFIYAWLFGGICICVSVGRHLYKFSYRGTFV